MREHDPESGCAYLLVVACAIALIVVAVIVYLRFIA